MPRLNLKDDELEEGHGSQDLERTVAPPPTLRDVGSGGGRSPIVLIIVIVAVLAAVVFALNYFKVVNLWGKKAPAVTETLPEPDLPMPEEGTALEGGGTAGGATSEPSTQAPASAIPEPTNVPEVTSPTGAQGAPSTSTSVPSSRPPKSTPSPSIPTSGGGSYTVQFSSWMSRSTAEREVAKLSVAGLTAFVEDGLVNGETWYRVRVGRYSTQQEAATAASELQKMAEGPVIVAKVGR